MKATPQQRYVCINHYEREMMAFIAKMNQYKVKLLETLIEYDFNEDKGLDFFIQLAEDAVSFKCQQHYENHELVKSAMKQIDEILNDTDE